jgi:hypothetical protein
MMARALATSRLARRLALETLDANGDQKIGVLEILSLQDQGDSELGGFIAFVRQEMGLDPAKEDLAGFG